jgi:hypothetical protein
MHSPGPWKALVEKPTKKRPGTAMVVTSNGTLAMEVSQSGSTWDESIDNARLISAAPDMLAALQDTVLQLQYIVDKFGETGTGAKVLARVNAAIAKATH